MTTLWALDRARDVLSTLAGNTANSATLTKSSSTSRSVTVAALPSPEPDSWPGTVLDFGNFRRVIDAQAGSVLSWNAELRADETVGATVDWSTGAFCGTEVYIGRGPDSGQFVELFLSRLGENIAYVGEKGYKESVVIDAYFESRQWTATDPPTAAEIETGYFDFLEGCEQMREVLRAQLAAFGYRAMLQDMTVTQLVNAVVPGAPVLGHAAALPFVMRVRA